jgi:hypothetical protein
MKSITDSGWMDVTTVQLAITALLLFADKQTFSGEWEIRKTTGILSYIPWFAEWETTNI